MSLSNATMATGLVHLTFNTIDYVLCFVMLTMSAGIGVYFGFFEKSANTTDEYLLGGKRMKTIPIALSFIASQLSGIALMSVPSELYNFGVDWAFCVFWMAIVVPVIYWIIAPILYNNNFSNCFQYLEERFDRTVRLTITWSVIMLMTILLPVYLFIPSLAFAQVTNMNIHIINVCICSVCVFYTLLGGIKAVIWTDVLQVTIMICAVILVCVLGIIKVGGLEEVLSIAVAGERLSPNFTFDVQPRNTVINIILNTSVLWLAQSGLNPSVVQRMLSLPKVENAQNAILYYGIGFIFIKLFLCLTGIVMYARFHDCDPIMAGVVSKPDQIIIYFVQDIVGNLMGMPGVFIAAVFSASLSTVSASLNALAGILYMDFIRPHIKHSESRANRIMKLCVFVLGVYCVLGGFIAQHFKSMLQISQMVGGIFCGTIAGTFLIGMLLPQAHARAILIAALTSISSIALLSVGANDNFYAHKLPVSIEGCPLDMSSNQTSVWSIENNSANSQNAVLSWLSNISYNWYMPLGFTIVIFVGTVLSFALKADKHFKVNPKLLIPMMQTFVKYEPAKTSEDLTESGGQADNML